MFKNCSTEKSWKIIRKHLKGMVLDLGSFDGLLVAQHGNSVGLEIQPTKSYIPLVVGDIHSLPFREESFSTVVMCHVLEHTDKPEIVMRDVRRVLKLGGNFIVEVPNARALAALLLKKLIGYDNYAYSNPRLCSMHWLHKSFWGYESLKKIIRQSHFTIEESYRSTPHLPIIERIFDYGPLRRLSWVLGDFDKMNAKDLIFVCRKTRR